MSILFVCKQGIGSAGYSHGKKHSGLFNSTEHIAEALRSRGIEAHVVTVLDNNSIDREVARHKPNIVVIEALWVVPEKFEILKRLHPKVRWFVHLHSNIPFLANEGVALEWIPEYLLGGIEVLVNSVPAYQALSDLFSRDVIHLLPNVYLRKAYTPKAHKERSEINIGCFGAIRPMKNQLIQAMAALEFARQHDYFLRFHINSTRVEQLGASVLRNLRSLFEQEIDAELVEHDWFGPEDFIKFLHKHIDIGMQVSLSETFNVVTADYVTAGLPVVVSKEVSWVSHCCQVDTDSAQAIADKLSFVLDHRLLIRWNQRLLKNYSRSARERWVRFYADHK